MDAKPTLEPTEWQREIANDCANMVCDPDDFVRGETHIVDAIAAACARQREEDAKIAETVFTSVGWKAGKGIAVAIRNGGK